MDGLISKLINMKKILFSFLVLCSLVGRSQDSVKITIAPQTRDLEYIASIGFTDNALENFFDSLKVKFRVPSPPTGNTTVSFTAYTMDWVLLIQRLKTDEVALQANCTSRIEALLRAVGQTYLTAKIDDVDTDKIGVYTNRRQFGRSRLRRN